jgi:hypothetical protein
MFRDIADVLVLGAAGQGLATDHYERGRDFGSGRGRRWHDHLRVSAEILEFDPTGLGRFSDRPHLLH